MTKERIEKAIEIINYAINNQISVKVASVACGYADTYVKNIKAIVYEKYENGTLEDELFSQFDTAYSKYIENRKQFGIKDKDEEKPVVTLNKPADLPPAANGKEQLTFERNGNKAIIDFRTDDKLLGNSPIDSVNQENLKNFVEDNESYPKNHIKTLDELLDYLKVDREVWRVERTRLNKWDVTSWSEGYPRTIQNFQVRADLVRNIRVVKERMAGEIFIDMIKDYKPPVFQVKNIDVSKSNENNLFEISIFDLHMGKLAWGGETGENYDTKIARARFLESIEKLVHRASGFNYSRILFPVGNDFFNSDTIFNTTTQGTQQDEDLRWQKTFNVGTRLLVDAINLLKQTGRPIDVIVIPGNHDFERSYYMGKFLEAWFNNDPSVTMYNGASPRKYYRFGKVLLGFTHGSEEKESSLPLLMATDIESKPMWSETIYHEWHLGHIHRKRNVNYSVIDTKERTLNEDLGVTIRYLSSLTGTEEWHHKKGFVGAIKAADAFIWNDELGLIAHLNSNIIIE
jgi:hypothetical protein